MENVKKIKINYGDKKFIKNVFYKSFPLIIGVISIGLINIVDNAMIGIFQESHSSELAAASLANKFLKLMNIFISSAISMVSFLLMQYAGKKDADKIKSILRLMYIFTTFCIIVAILVAFLLTDQIMHFFQGKNFNNDSTMKGIAQNYLKVLIFEIIPATYIQITLIGLIAFKKQKWHMWLTFISIFANIFLNWMFYKLFNFGLNGIAYSTILVEFINYFTLIFLITRSKIRKYLLFNPLKLFHLDSATIKMSIKKYPMAMQVILWNFITLGISIIYSRWYGDKINEILAIVLPITSLFYSALDGIANTKGYFVGKKLGVGDFKKALINDKRINLYVFLVAIIEGLMLISFSYFLPLIWANATDFAKERSTILLIILGSTYPIAALSKTLLGSLKVAGMGKMIILYNGLYALFFEFLIPLILYIINIYTQMIVLEFWQLYLISRTIKLLKLPPTYYIWKKKKWLRKSI